MEKVNVTKTFLPDKMEYFHLLEEIWKNGWLTNNGPLVQRLESNVKDFLQIDNFSFVGNGTIAIQIAIKALGLSGSVITTPFSYCATTTSLLWENIEPIFVDIKEDDLNLDPNLIEAAIKEDTTAILATHVYGNPCDTETIEKIAKKHNLKVIYDAAHAFGVKYKNRSLLSYGDVSTCSFHSTKVFHTIEGGCIISNSDILQKEINLMRSFGHIQDSYYSVGVNGKNSEFHAAMGLVNLKHVNKIISDRKNICAVYDQHLDWTNLKKVTEISDEIVHNYAYYPIVLESEEKLIEVTKALADINVVPRRYFYPSLNTLPYLKTFQKCIVSESVAPRVLSLPLFPDLEINIVKSICEAINNVTK